MRILISGDLHCDTMEGVSLIHRAKKQDCDKLLFCGDFGYWPRQSPKHIKTLNREAVKKGITIYWLDGNHEDFDALDIYMRENPPSDDGLYWMANNVAYIPRGHAWKWGGRKFCAIGGAHSIDKHHRTEGVDWFRQELTTQANIWTAIHNTQAIHGCDVLLSHDAPLDAGILDYEKLDTWTRGNQQLIQHAMDSLQPQYLFHGHYHKFHITRVDNTNIIGLHMNGEPGNTFVYDTEVSHV